tara:strand:- start:104 stop:733 length:630 start_codon:yes stop_codon:yes gene_type:complete
MQYNFIVIEGNIGVGKTTLATMLAKDYNTRLILEEFEENPFLPKFYKDPNKYAFPLELFFMAERYHQLKKEKEHDLFQPITITDYFFMKSKLFAKNNLKNDEQQLFESLFNIMYSSLPKPDILVYLYADVIRLKDNIKKRGRGFEQSITSDYLQNIQEIYLDYLRKQDSFPVLVFDISCVDFKKDENIYKKIYLSLDKNYTAGLHNFKL